MSVAGVPGSKVVLPGGGEDIGMGLFGVSFKLLSRDTDSAISIVEHPFDVGAIVPVHQHTREDEYSIVLEGEMGFRSGDREAVLGPGGYITKPRREMHTMWNAGAVPARIIEIISPGGFEQYFHDLADLLTDDRPEPDAIAELAARYGLTFGDPAWPDGVVRRYGLVDPWHVFDSTRGGSRTTAPDRAGATWSCGISSDIRSAGVEACRGRSRLLVLPD
ncbi:cupin domain-containing protein [Amycolatopsis sp. NPDC023774]|uniref:cupin domain-containing protein n=1 Tax=Amycolatopsis sp. NPDC023774 TaxID=3155015 RepID=UPI003405968C